jgi:hypothetical protein
VTTATLDLSNTKVKNVTCYGRLSWPVWTAQESYDRSQKGQYPAKSVAEAKPYFELVVEQHQLDKVKAAALDYIRWCVAREAAGEKKDILTQAEADMLINQIETPDFAGMLNLPFKPLSESTAKMAPAGVAAVKVLGNAGVDIEQKAIVNDEDELLVPEPDLLSFPVIRPINRTVHSMYPGAQVAVTMNFYVYHPGKGVGLSAGVSVAVFKADDERFGGGVSIDEDEIFAD